MRFSIYRKSKANMFLGCTVFIILSIISIAMAFYSFFNENTSIFISLICICVTLYCILAAVHIIKSLYPYILLDNDKIIIRVLSKPFFRMVKEVKYSEIDKIYSSIQDVKKDEESCGVEKVGTIDEMHGVAFHIKQEIYIIAVEDPLGFREELVKHMQANGVYM